MAANEIYKKPYYRYPAFVSFTGMKGYSIKRLALILFTEDNVALPEFK
jgi:hypothetical protein